MRSILSKIRLYEPKNRLIRVLAWGLLGTILAILLTRTWLVQQYEMKTFDHQMRIRESISPIAVSDDIVILVIDDDTVSELGWPIPRSQYALTLKLLREVARVDVVVFDILMSNPDRDPSEDLVLAAITKQVSKVIHPAILGPQSEFSRGISQDEGECLGAKGWDLPASVVSKLPIAIEAITPVSEICQAAEGTGNIWAEADQDGIVRRIPMLTAYHGEVYPALSLSAVTVFLGIGPDRIGVTDREISLLAEDRKLRIPLERNWTALVNYPHKREVQRYSFLGATQILVSEEPEDAAQRESLISALRGKLVFIGSDVTGDVDAKSTPFTTDEAMVYVHAAMCNAILQNAMLRPLSKVFFIAISAILALGIAFMVSYSKYLWHMLCFVGVCILSYVSASILSFAYLSVWMPLFQPSLTFVMSFTFAMGRRYVWDKNEMIEALEQLQTIRERMEHRDTAIEVMHTMQHKLDNSLMLVTTSIDRVINKDSNLSGSSSNILNKAQRSLRDIKHTFSNLRAILLGESPNRDTSNVVVVEESSDPDKSFTVVDLNSTVRDTCSTFRRELEEKRIALHENLASSSLLVRIDKGELTDAIFNLINNAIEAMEAGGTLTVLTLKDSNKACLSIKDTGIGIPEDVNVFEMGYTTKPNGHGLGLSDVQRTVRKFSGTIGYESKIGKGTTFHIQFPCAEEGE